MKTITGIAVAAFIATTVNISGAGCGECAADLEHAQHDHVESLEADHQHANQLTQCAIALFRQLGSERASLATKAEGGCEKSATTLIEDEIKSVEGMLAAMENEESRRILQLGMMLQEWTSNPGADDERVDPAGVATGGAPGSGDYFDSALDDIRERLKAQLAQYQMSIEERSVEN